MNIHFTKEKSFSQEEGVQYKELFGFADGSDFVEFRILSYYDYELLVYYRVTDDDYIQFISELFLTDDEISEVRQVIATPQRAIKTQFKYNYNRTAPNNMLDVFEKMVEGKSLFDGLPFKIDSAFISENQLKETIKKIRAKRCGKPHQSKLYDLLKSSNLHPTTYDFENGLYLSNCVNSSAHKMYISITDDVEEFGCGYCKRKGGVRELQTWLDEKKAKKL